MLTKKDRQQLIEDMKQVFPNKEELDQKLTKLRKDIGQDVIDILEDGVHPQIDKLDKRTNRVEKHLGLPSSE